MKIYKSKLHGVKRLVLNNFEDHRGTYLELYDGKNHAEACNNTKFVQDDISVSRNFWWPITNPILSLRDENGKYL